MQMCCRHRDSRARSWNPGCWRCHLCVPPETRDSHRAPLGPCFSADSVLSAPADLCGHWSSWSLGGCVFWWGPESEAASLHLPHHSPCSHLLRGNVCHRRGGRHRDSCKPQESSWLYCSLQESSQEEMPQAHRAAPSSQGHRSSGVTPVTWQGSGAALLLSIPPHLHEEFGISSCKAQQTLSQGWDGGFCRQKHSCHWCGRELTQSKVASSLKRITRSHLFWGSLERVQIILLFLSLFH